MFCIYKQNKLVKNKKVLYVIIKFCSEIITLLMLYYDILSPREYSIRHSLW